ncbi:MAG: serine/threonine-protein kinase [Kofleriaceae bacterium]
MLATMAPPERIGRFEIVVPLAQGGMGEVYLARASGLGGFVRHVVLKTMEVFDADDDEAEAMFFDEARVLGVLHHQHIVPVFDVARADDRLFIVMDYVHGHTSHEAWQRTVELGAALPIDFALTVTSAAAAGLHYAHTRRASDGTSMRIVHRDVSLSNIMVGFDGAVKMIDFGIAKAAGRSAKTQVGYVKGKLGYMAPEQIAGESVDSRTDVFALGIVLYELTTMRRAFREESDQKTIERIKRGAYEPPTSVVPGYPPELAKIVTRALRTDPRERFPDADSLRRAIEAFGHAMGMLLGDAAVAEVMSQLFEDRREPWQRKPTGRAETELEVPLEVISDHDLTTRAASRGETARRLRNATDQVATLRSSSVASAIEDTLGNRPSSIDEEFREIDNITVASSPDQLAKLVRESVAAGEGASASSSFTAISSPPPPPPSHALPPPPPPPRPPASLPLSNDTDGVPVVKPLPVPAIQSPKLAVKKKPALKTHMVLPATGRGLSYGWIAAGIVMVAAVGVSVYGLVFEDRVPATRPAVTPDAGAPAPDAAVAPIDAAAAPADILVVSPPGAKVRLTITTIPSEDVTLILDGKRLGKAPYNDLIESTPGIHVLKARRRGYATTKVEFELTADVTREITLPRAPN